MRMTRCDIVVIGGGIAGMSAAARLAQSGAEVCVLEAEMRPDYHSTGRSAAIYVHNFGNAVVRGLTAASRSFYDAPPTGFTEYPLLSPRGVMTVASAQHVDALTAQLEAGEGMHVLERDAARARVPVLREEWLAAAALEPQAQDIDVNAVHMGFQRQCKAAGGQLVCAAPVTTLERKDGVWRVQTPQGVFCAPVVVNAAGAWADTVAARAGVATLGLRPLRRTAVIIEPPPGIDVRDWPMVFSAGDDFYFKPEAGKLMLSPVDATPDRPGDVQPEDLDVAVAVDRLEQAVNFSVDRIAHRWAGLRTFAPDDALVIGWDAQAEGFFWLAGQGGYGIATAPAASLAAAHLIGARPWPDALRQASVQPQDLAPQRLSA